ncbi:MAG: ABC-F family ATP-binding cassette domain-containing protein [Myxococcales bacterium]|nr:ABC-F family ATP-binding cassette domain-containing protein [Myxococcales bacterium]
MPIIAAKELTKSYGTRSILGGVSLTIDEGERVGLIGSNGSGKSTLARILAGLELPDGGEVIRRRDLRVAILDQVPHLPAGASAGAAVLAGLDAWRAAQQRYTRATAELSAGRGDHAALIAEQSAAAEAIERLGGWEREHEAHALLARLGVADPEAPVDALSGGERRRVALARLLVSAPDLAILDEPTNHLDVETIEWLERHLADSFRGALLLITHDRYFLDRLADRTAEIDRGQLYLYDGGFEDYLAARAERQAHAQRVEANRQNFLRRELEWLRRQPKARTTKQKARIDRAEAAIAEGPPAADRNVSLRLAGAHGGKTVVELRDVSLSQGGHTLFRHLTLALREGERIGILGPNGCGKTTLLRAIVGDHPPSAGEVVLGRAQRVAYLDQARSGLDDRASVREAIAGDRRTVTIGEQTIDIAAYLARFLFDGEAAIQKVGTLSGGERARVALARMLQHKASLVLLDEPTNDLDIATLGAVEEMLLEFGGTAIVVTHDRWFLDRVATAILAFEGDGEVVLYQGNYSTYLALRAQAEAQAKAEAEAPPAKAAKASAASTPTPARAPASSGPRRLTYGERLELEALPAKIDAAEAEVAALGERLSDPAIYQPGGPDVAALSRALEAARATSAALMERWEELEGRREATEG